MPTPAQQRMLSDFYHTVKSFLGESERYVPVEAAEMFRVIADMRVIFLSPKIQENLHLYVTGEDNLESVPIPEDRRFLMVGDRWLNCVRVADVDTGGPFGLGLMYMTQHLVDGKDSVVMSPLRPEPVPPRDDGMHAMHVLTMGDAITPVPTEAEPETVDIAGRAIFTILNGQLQHSREMVKHEATMMAERATRLAIKMMILLSQEKLKKVGPNQFEVAEKESQLPESN